MDPEVRFQQIEALLRAGTERGNEMESRFNRRMDRAERRMDRADARAKAAEERAEKRMELFDKRLEATRKLVEAGIKMVADIARRQKVNEAEIRQLRKSQQAYFDSLRRGNGNGRH